MSELTPLESSLAEDIALRLSYFRPHWIKGSLSHRDAVFLYSRVLASSPSRILELGTGSGFSTGLMAHALEMSFRSRATGRHDGLVTSFDVNERLFSAPDRETGDAAREMFEQQILNRIDFRFGARSRQALSNIAPKSFSFVFIDANHRHPWPTLDLLLVLDFLADITTLVLHDINLPLIHPKFDDWGAKVLFDSLEGEKTQSDEDPPNMGAVLLSQDKRALRRHLEMVLHSRPWQEEVPNDVLRDARSSIVFPSFFLFEKE